jgi:small subunit ribosomal protein S3
VKLTLVVAASQIETLWSCGCCCCFSLKKALLSFSSKKKVKGPNYKALFYNKSFKLTIQKEVYFFNMGQKIHPLGFRLGITQEHRSKWFAKSKDYPRLVLEDKKLRDYLFQEYPSAGIVDIKIYREQMTQDIETKEFVEVTEITVYAAVPGKFIGRSKTSGNKITINELRENLEKVCNLERLKQNLPPIRIVLTLLKVQNPYSSASVIADYLIAQLEERVPFRSALRKSFRRIEKSTKLQGIKIAISGRLNGAEIARSEWVRKGRVPLQTLRADIDYSAKTAKTIYGILGIKVWTFRGEQT